MSVVEDTRKAVQDFLAPELREVRAKLDGIEKRIDALEKHTDERFATLEKHMDGRFVAADLRFTDLQRSLDERFNSAEKSANTRHEAVVLMFQAAFKLAEVERRLGTLEGEKKTISQ